MIGSNLARPLLRSGSLLAMLAIKEGKFTMKFLRLLLLGLLVISASSNSEEIDSEATKAKYVSVTFEIQGLGESTNAVKEAMSSLSSSMKEISKSPQKLTAEQIREFGVLIEKSDKLVISLERTLKEVNPTLQSAKKPTTEMLAALLKTTRSEIVNPTVKSVKDTVGFWVYLFVFGGIVIVGLIGFSFYSTTKQIREMVKIAKSITNEYEIVRRKI